MTTANAIEAMTDAGEFEILATRVLREIDKDYARVEHLGVNADGKTVKNPVDGFTKVPGSEPSKFVIAAFSTDKTESIEKKLLFDHTQSTGKSYKPSNDGDLIKASRLAQEIREQNPDAQFVFTFCTNKQPSNDVMQNGYDIGSQLGIEVRFLARSSIRDHLDTTPEGQWLRKEHLGISADKLSLPLLRELCLQSVSAYLTELFCSEDAIVDTATTNRLLTQTTHHCQNITILSGPSGSGKSVACYRLVSELTTNDGIGLWLPAEIVASSTSFDDAITKSLRVFCPTLELDAGRLTQALASKHKVPLVIVVDDVNRTANPTQVIQKLITWNRRSTPLVQSSGATNNNLDFPHLVIPVWNYFWNSIANNHRNNHNIGEYSAQPMTADEAYRCLQACSQQPIRRQFSVDLASKLEFDPILIGLWGKLYGHSPLDHLDTEPRSLITDYIQQSVSESSADGKFLSADINYALEALSERMLSERELYPRWSLVLQWLSDSQLNALRKLCISGGICRVVKRDHEDRLTFRHDRLLEAVLAKPLGASLGDIEGNHDIVSDPYFTDSLALALVSIGNAEIVRKLIDHAPLAILQAIQELSDPGSEFAKEVMDCGGRWLQNAVKDETTPPQIVFTAANILSSIRNPMVLTVTEEVKGDHRFSGARLLNGDAENGKFFVAGDFFYPGSLVPFIEDTILDAKRFSLPSLCEQLTNELQQAQHSEQALQASLILSGYLGDSSLAEPVLQVWKHSADNKYLVSALWASLRCSTEPEVTLAPILDSWASLSNEEDQYGESEQTGFLTELKWCLRHGINDNVVGFLIYRAEDDESLLHSLTELLSEIDHPLAIRFVADVIARFECEQENPKDFSFWLRHLRDKWDPLGYNGKRLSGESRSTILSLWESTEDECKKNSLLHTWSITTDSLEELLKLPEESLVLSSVLLRRASLGDQSCLDSVLELLNDNLFWWDVIPLIWTDRIIDKLDAALIELGAKTPDDYSGGRLNDHYHISRVLQNIPFEIAENLLLKHWDSLKYSPKLFQTALYIGGDKLLSACKEVMTSAPADWKPFEHIRSTFGFKTSGLKERLTYKHIHALLPYLAHVSDLDLMEIAAWFKQHGGEDILQGNMWDEIRRRVEMQKSEDENPYILRAQKIHYPSEDDLLEALDAAEKDSNMIWIWCDQATERGDSKEQLRKIVRQWFAQDPTLERLRAVAKIVVEIGGREDVLNLQEYQCLYGDDTTKAIVEGVSFLVKYRTLS